MDRNTITGFVLIFLLYIGYSIINAPSAEEQKRRLMEQDSLTNLTMTDTNQVVTNQYTIENDTTLSDSTKAAMVSQRNYKQFGEFAQSANGEEQEFVLENEKIRITFSNKGGKIKAVEVKDYLKYVKKEDGSFGKAPVVLLEDENNVFEYAIPAGGVNGNEVYTSDFYFNGTLSGKSLSFKLPAANGGYFEQIYTLKDNYTIDYKVNVNNLATVIPRKSKEIRLNWVNYIDKIEKSPSYEKNYTNFYYKRLAKSPTYTAATNNDKQFDEQMEWVCHSQQFFNSTLIAKEIPFEGTQLVTKSLDLEQGNLKQLAVSLGLPLKRDQNQTFNMEFYIGPNKFDDLKALSVELEDIIPYGWSIFGAVNRYLFRPLFGLFSKFIGSYGLIILLLTILVKMALFPLQYKMILSSIKMGILRPEMAKLKEKYAEEPQKLQTENMKLYQQSGVNPLGGCMPSLLQMPIWIALYRFFPASIEFRQRGFLWADDLSSYDSILDFGYIPGVFEIYGDHISLFTLLWVVSMLGYLYYNAQNMDMSANPAMKYIQYLFPFIFFFVLNSWAAGLTAYMLFSNLMNIGQTLVTKKILVDEDKVRKEMEENRKNPKKKGGFAQRLEDAMKQQEELKKQQSKKANQRKK